MKRLNDPGWGRHRSGPGKLASGQAKWKDLIPNAFLKRFALPTSLSAAQSCILTTLYKRKRDLCLLCCLRSRK